MFWPAISQSSSKLLKLPWASTWCSVHTFEDLLFVGQLLSRPAGSKEEDQNRPRKMVPKSGWMSEINTDNKDNYKWQTARGLHSDASGLFIKLRNITVWRIKSKKNFMVLQHLRRLRAHKNKFEQPASACLSNSVHVSILGHWLQQSEDTFTLILHLKFLSGCVFPAEQIDDKKKDKIQIDCGRINAETKWPICQVLELSSFQAPWFVVSS